MANTALRAIVCTYGQQQRVICMSSDNRHAAECRNLSSAASYVSFVLALSFTTASGATTFDGSRPLVCVAEHGHNCLPSQSQCTPLQRETKTVPQFEIDFAGKTVRSPYRTALLHVSAMTVNRESIVLQGNDLLFAWSSLINKTTGALTISVADRQGAYVVFGQCRVSPGK